MKVAVAGAQVRCGPHNTKVNIEDGLQVGPLFASRYRLLKQAFTGRLKIRRTQTRIERMTLQKIERSKPGVDRVLWIERRVGGIDENHVHPGCQDAGDIDG